MRLRLILLCAFLGSALWSGEHNFTTLLTPECDHWNWTVRQLARRFPRCFSYQDRTRNSLLARHTYYRRLKLFDCPLVEIIVSLSEERKITRYSFTFFSRGDSPPMRRNDFRALVTRLRQTIDNFTQAATPAPTQNLYVGGVKIKVAQWQTANNTLQLRWSDSHNQPEYLILEVRPPQAAATDLRKDLKTQAQDRDLPRRIHRDPDGSCYLVIPMVDQGSKGYCVVATIERVLRYYGGKVDQHLLAQLAKSDAAKGTYTRLAIDALNDLKNKIDIRTKELYCSPLIGRGVTYKYLKKRLKEYNSLAKKFDREKIRWRDLNTSGRYFWNRLYQALDYEVYAELRSRDKTAFRHFQKDIQKYIDEGIPLCWVTATLPKSLDNPYPRVSRHMRLINGYNLARGELIYTDSWGPGHEKKTMKFRDGWAITQQLWIIEPH